MTFEQGAAFCERQTAQMRKAIARHITPEMAEWLLSDRERLIEQIARCERDYGSDHVLLKADRDEFESKFVKAAQDAANLRLRVEELEEELLEWREGLARSIGMRENP